MLPEGKVVGMIKTDWAQMGQAATLPGLQFAVEVLQAQLDAMRAQLIAQQNGSMKIDSNGQVGYGTKKRGRPKKESPQWSVKQKHLITHSYWAAMTPEQRSAEMKRRLAVRRGESKPQGTAKYLKKVKAA